MEETHSPICILAIVLSLFIDVFPENQLYIMFSAENSGVQLGSYVVSIQFVSSVINS